MNKRELVNYIADSADLSGASAERALNAILQAITGELSAGGRVVIPGFGSFQVQERSARTGRNPRTGEEIAIAASKAPTFRAGKALKEAVQQ